MDMDYLATLWGHFFMKSNQRRKQHILFQRRNFISAFFVTVAQVLASAAGPRDLSVYLKQSRVIIEVTSTVPTSLPA